jgi:hypothetical protein
VEKGDEETRESLNEPACARRFTSSTKVSEPRGCFLKQKEEKLWKNNKREISCLLFKHVEISIFCGHHLRKRIKIIPQHAHIVPIFPIHRLVSLSRFVFIT